MGSEVALNRQPHPNLCATPALRCPPPPNQSILPASCFVAGGPRGPCMRCVARAVFVVTKAVWVRSFQLSAVAGVLRGAAGSRMLVLLHDMVAAGAAFFLSVWFAFGLGLQWAGPKQAVFYGWSSASFALIAAIVFVTNDLHKGVWRFTSFRDLKIIVRSAALTVLYFLPVLFLTSRGAELPRSSILLSFLFLVALLAAPRIASRMFQEGGAGALAARRGDRVPVYVVGVGARAESFVRETARDAHSPYEVVGLIAPSIYWLHRHVQGVPVVGALEQLGELFGYLDRSGHPVQRLVLADEGLTQAAKDKILALTSERGISLGRLPGSTEIHEASVSDGNQVKPVALEDLLHRPQKRLDRQAMSALIAGRRVLVTGAGGSIGSELVRQIASFGPSHLSLVDNCEYNLYAIDQEIGLSFGGLSRTAILGDVRERRSVAQTFQRENPEIVFHAAAYKHVPMVEQNPLEGVRTNVIGSRNVADECVRQGVLAMVMISTDKAVNPTNVMGATKRLAEAYAQALDTRASKTHFVTVRFGNVLGSTGSVVPLFQKQIAAGGPITVTHPDITRYFMTIREAVQLVLQASAFGVAEPEHRGKLFVLDMGAPVKIADLARQMIRLAGKRPDVDVEIKYVGLRPGEKLHEELLHDREPLVDTVHAGLMLAAPRAGEAAMLSRDIDALEAAVVSGDEQRALKLLKHAIPEFTNDRLPDDPLRRDRRLVLVRT
jgi:FlaA1/EpsC-like NDP-sugar epimerase